MRIAFLIPTSCSGAPRYLPRRRLAAPVRALLSGLTLLALSGIAAPTAFGTFSPQDVMRPIEQVGGAIHDVMIGPDGRIFAGVGARVVELATVEAGGQVEPEERETTLRLVGRSAPLQGIVQAIDLEAGFIYVALGAHGVAVLDARQPGVLLLKATLPVPGDVRHVDAHGSLLAIAAGGGSDPSQDGGLRIARLAPPGAPVLIGHLDTPGWAGRVALGAGAAILADGERIRYPLSHGGSGSQIRTGSVYVIDLSDPSQPVVEKTLGPPAGIHHVAADGRWFYVLADGSASGFQRPEKPSALWVLERDGIGGVWLEGVVEGNWGNCVDLAKNGNHLVAACHALRLFDVTDPRNPTIVAEDESYVETAAVSEDGTLLSAGMDGAVVWRTPAREGVSTSATELAIGGHAWHVAPLAEDRAAVLLATMGSTLASLHFEEPIGAETSAPTWDGRLPLPAASNDLATWEGKAYVSWITWGDSVAALAKVEWLEDGPRIAEQWPFDLQQAALATSKDGLLAAGWRTIGTTEGGPIPRPIMQPVLQTRPLALDTAAPRSESTPAFCGIEEWGFPVMDRPRISAGPAWSAAINDCAPFVGVALATIDRGEERESPRLGVEGIAQHEGRLLFASPGSLHVADPRPGADPDASRDPVVQWSSTPSMSRSRPAGNVIALWEDVAFIAQRESRLAVVSQEGSGTPTLLGQVELPRWPRSVAVVGDRLLVAVGDLGVLVFDPAAIVASLGPGSTATPVPGPDATPVVTEAHTLSLPLILREGPAR